jgi:polar amino acid transport system permease protein
VTWAQFLTTYLDFNAMAAVLPSMIMTGLKNTLIISIISTLIALVLGMLVAVMAISPTRWLRVPAQVYTDVFRGLPAAVTILLVGQGLAPLSTPIFGPSPYPLGILSLSLIAAAYIGEIFRSGIQSVDRGQLEACRALGMRYGTAMRLVVIPQGVRRVLPALVNQFIGNVKDSSLVYFLGMLTSERELFRIGQDYGITTGNLSPLLLAGVFYLVITVPLTHIVNYLDKRFKAGRRKPTAPVSGLDEITTAVPVQDPQQKLGERG